MLSRFDLRIDSMNCRISISAFRITFTHTSMVSDEIVIFSIFLPCKFWLPYVLVFAVRRDEKYGSKANRRSLSKRLCVPSFFCTYFGFRSTALKLEVVQISLNSPSLIFRGVFSFAFADLTLLRTKRKKFFAQRRIFLVAAKKSIRHIVIVSSFVVFLSVWRSRAMRTFHWQMVHLYACQRYNKVKKSISAELEALSIPLKWLLCLSLSVCEFVRSYTWAYSMSYIRPLITWILFFSMLFFYSCSVPWLLWQRYQNHSPIVLMSSNFS